MFRPDAWNVTQRKPDKDRVALPLDALSPLPSDAEYRTWEWWDQRVKERRRVMNPPADYSTYENPTDDSYVYDDGIEDLLFSWDGVEDEIERVKGIIDKLE